MRIGQLDRSVELRVPSVTYDSYNQPTFAYSTRATVYANRTDKSVSEINGGEIVTSVVRTEFKIRYRLDVLPTWQVREGDEVFEIVGIRQLGRREALVLVCVLRESLTGGEGD